MKFGLNASEAVVLREALMSYRNNHVAADWREPSDGFRVATADDLLGRLDAHGRMILAEEDERANRPVSLDTEKGGVEITLPYSKADETSEGYWERAYWRVVPSLVRALVSELGSTEPESTLPTHETTYTAGIGTD